jgi:hypothetical protein
MLTFFKHHGELIKKKFAKIEQTQPSTKIEKQVAQ